MNYTSLVNSHTGPTTLRVVDLIELHQNGKWNGLMASLVEKKYDLVLTALKVKKKALHTALTDAWIMKMDWKIC